MIEATTALGVGERTVKGAKTRLGVRSTKSGFGKGGEWHWCLDDAKGAKDSHMGNLAPLDESASEGVSGGMESRTLSERMGR